MTLSTPRFSYSHMVCRYGVFALALPLTFTLASPLLAQATKLPAQGQWDGVTAKATLDRPYEDPRQATVPFGLISYFAHPWRSYMDTWPSNVFPNSLAFVQNTPDKYADAVCQVFSEAGIKQVRYEIGWGNFSWNDKLEGAKRENTLKTLQTFKKYGMRPLILLNSHHAAPCPFKNINVELVADAKKGDRQFKVKDATGIVPFFTGPMNPDEYSAAKPLVTSVDADGTVHLGGPLSTDLKAGGQPLWVLKYQPFHGVEEKDATPERNAMWAREAQRTLDGWNLYVQETCALAQEALGTKGQPDAGFDLEVWNEQTFGSNFLDINHYLEPGITFTKPVSFTINRPLSDAVRPDAKTEFRAEGYGTMLLLTDTFVNTHHKEYPGVIVDNGIGNQWPWNGGADASPGEGAFSRHYYLGDWRDISPTSNSRADLQTINALGQGDGKRPDQPRDWYDIVPGSNFIPTVRVGMPEWGYMGFQTESIVRDVMPDSRVTGAGTNHGRFTHNGDFHLSEMYQTEFNYGRGGFFGRLFDETKVPREDPRALKLDSWFNSKVTLRSYVFQNAKGMSRLYIFAPGDGPYGIGSLSPLFYSALDKANGQLTPEVRATIPSMYKGLAWMTKQMQTTAPEVLAAPRQLRVDELVEYKPRLQYAGDGTPARPNQWNREQFAFLPYQVSARKFVVPYYVVTLDANQIYDAKKDPFDPARYSMPDQDFDVTIGNCAGQKAVVSAYDPLTNTAVPVTVVGSTASSLTVKLKTVDYPRVLVVEEATEGPQILDPKVSADKNGVLALSWKTNVPVNAVKVTWGKDWQNRGVNEMTVAGGKSQYAIKIPTGTKGVLATRIKVVVNGLTSVWPRWDEDPAGQIVVPGSTKADLATPAPATTTVGGTSTAPADLVMPAGVKLAVEEKNGRGYSLKLPAGATLTGPLDDREALVGAGAEAMRVRARYVVGGAANAASSLPFPAVGDVVDRQAVKLTSGATGSLASYTLVLEQHPGVTATRQKYLTVPFPNGDLLVVSLQGTPAAMQAQDKTATAIFASVTTNAK